jgi:glycogen phosphorylase
LPQLTFPHLELPGSMSASHDEISAAAIKQRILENLEIGLARQPQYASPHDWYMAVAMAVRGLLVSHWYSGTDVRSGTPNRVVAYLSAEFLLGPHLQNNMICLGVYPQVRQAVSELGRNLDDLIWEEPEPGLGNGGLGRLAACYMDSLSTLQIPAIGYGIRYEFGIFRQEIHDGWQVEMSDGWLRSGNPWEIVRPQNVHQVGFGGRVENISGAAGRLQMRWIPDRIIKGVAYDTPIVGYRVPWVNLLRLWKAEAYEPFDFRAFNTGDYYGAVEDKVQSENITKVLYPNDEQVGGKILRLEQQYFFASCSLQDMLRLHRLRRRPITDFHRYWTIQLNDTHPSIAVAELMRLLLDEYELGWENAWEITRNAFAYTNHTLLPEALEKWPVEIFSRLLPRHLQIIYEINARFLEQVRERFPGDEGRVARLSVIDEGGGRYVRMAHLASIASRRINGVAQLHSELLKRDVLRDFADLYPERFTNVTNGVTPRRWLAVSIPSLTDLITRKIGTSWLSNLETELRRFEDFADDPEVQEEVHLIKLGNKRRLVHDLTGVKINPESMFDAQVKRIHEYKRQHLNILHVITLYHRLKREPGMDMMPRTFLFGGKAAPGYALAKLIIKLINSVAGVVNNDRDIDRRLTVVFIPDFNIKTGQHIYPAADLSEQISTAGKEASGTGNMKFAMNGALTIGTLDGANIELRDAVGKENFFLFGLTTQEVQAAQAHGYRPRDFYERDAELREAIDAIAGGAFSGGDAQIFGPLVDSLLNHDPFLVLADYHSYVEAQSQVSSAYGMREQWARRSILNIARTGQFSSDRAIREYDTKIWRT